MGRGGDDEEWLRGPDRVLAMMRRGWTVLTGAVLLAVLALVLSMTSVPYVALGPGPTVDTLGKGEDGKPIIQISGISTSTSKGHLNLTTVSVTGDLDLATALRKWIDGDTAVVPREFVYPPGQSEQQTDKQNADQFKQSQNSAETAALRTLGYPVEVVVTAASPGSPSAGKLAVGDVIVSVDGHKVAGQKSLQGFIQAHVPGETIVVGVRHGGETGSVKVVATKSATDSSKAALGISIEEKQPHPFTVSFDLDKIGGPSAGLMFALGMVDKLEPEDLTGGIFVAGTGTIDDAGTVGPIGGIQQKLIAARHAGATVFLTPAENCAEARAAIPRGLKLVKVSSLDQALTALRTLRRGEAPASCG